MTTIPAEYWRAGANTQTAAVGVARLNDLRDVVAQAIGLWPPAAVTIAGGVVAPWTATGETITAGALLTVDTEGAASSDDLDRIDPTGLLDAADATASRLIGLATASAARVVRLRHAQGGVGQLLLPGGASEAVLDHPDILVLARWDPGASPRSWRVLGAIPCGRLLPWRSPLRLETWTTAGRPTNPGAQRLAWNSTLGRVETWTGSAWHQLLGPPDYTGAANAATGSQVYTFAHGFGAAPTWWTAELECLTAELGHASGDRVPIAGGRTSDGAIALSSVASAGSVRVLQRVTPRLIRPDSPGSDGQIDPTRWRYVVRAWR